MNDQQLDRLILATLAAESDRVAAAQPRLPLAMSRLASRVEGAPALALRPRVTWQPAPVGLSGALLLGLLLLALLAGVLVAGALLLRDGDGPSRPLGFGGSCERGLLEVAPGAVMVISSDAGTTHLYADGTLARDISAPTWDGTTAVPWATAVSGSAFTWRQLSAEGVELMLGRLAEAGLVDGCRSLRTRESSGHVFALTAGGPAGATWHPGGNAGPYRLPREVTSAEETRLTGLLEDLERPERWLPATAWIDDTEETVRPASWLVAVHLTPSGLAPGTTLSGGGLVLEGSDPRYALLQMPGGVEPGEFGSAYDAGAGQTLRCAGASRDEVIRLAESLDQLDAGPHSFSGDAWLRDEWFGGLMSTDLSQAVVVSWHPDEFFPGRAQLDCAALAAPYPDPPSESPPPPPQVTGDLAEVDPCSVVRDAALRNLGRDLLRRVPSRLALDRPAWMCNLAKAGTMYTQVYVTLYPQSLDQAAAERVAREVLGPDAAETEQSGLPMWANGCFVREEPCSYGIALLDGSQLLLIEVHDVPIMTSLGANAFIEALAANLAADEQP